MTGRSGDWRDSAFVDRERAVDEIHLRASYPIRRYARVSHLVRIMRSPSDLFREALFQRYWEAETRWRKHPPSLEEAPPEDWLLPAIKPSTTPADEIAEDIRRRRKAAEARQTITKEAMRALRTAPRPDNVVLRALAGEPDYVSLDDAHRALIAELKACRMALRPGERPESSLAGQMQAALSEIQKLVRLYAPGQPLDPSGASTPRDVAAPPGREPFERLMPFSPGGFIDPLGQFSARRVWLNLWKPEGPDTRPEDQGDGLRLNWELYDANHNFTAFEDFDTAEEAAAKSFFRPGKAACVIDTDRTALSRANSAIDAFTNGEFNWQGELFALSHFYVVPLKDVAAARLGRDDAESLLAQLSSGAEPDPNALAALRELVRAEARNYFQFPDKTRATGTREDFILTRVAGGAAVLVSDLRPHSRTDYHLERAARTVIFDICLTDEARGRLVKTCVELATYRMMGVRSYANFFPALEVFSDIGEEISEQTFGLQAGAWVPYFGNRDRLQELDLISARLDATNFFITDGVSGAAGQAMNFSRLAQDRLARLDERPIAGFQSASDIFGRFISSTLNVQRFAQRYEQVRRRVADASELVRADIDLSLQLLIIIVAGATGALTLLTADPQGAAIGWLIDNPVLPVTLLIILVVMSAALRLSPPRRKRKRPPDRSGGRF